MNKTASRGDRRRARLRQARGGCSRHAGLFCALVVWATAAGIAWGASADHFSQGNAAYERGDFAAARAQYEAALTESGSRPAVWFNLGNACFRQGELGRAILYWQRAARLAPRDREVRANLEYAGELCADRIEAPPKPFWARIIGSLQGLLTVGETWVLCLVAYWLAGGALVVGVKTGSERWRGALIRAATALAVVSLIASLSLAAKVYDETQRPAAVIVAREADVRSAPGSSFPITFTLHEGTVVRLGRRRGLWRHVAVANGLEGWVRSDTVETI